MYTWESAAKEINEPLSVPNSLMTLWPFGLVQTHLFATLSFMLLAKQSSYNYCKNSLPMGGEASQVCNVFTSICGYA